MQEEVENRTVNLAISTTTVSYTHLVGVDGLVLSVLGKLVADNVVDGEQEVDALVNLSLIHISHLGLEVIGRNVGGVDEDSVLAFIDLSLIHI